jgi:phage tail-like protein
VTDRVEPEARRRGQSAASARRREAERLPSMGVSHVADRCRLYPGEDVTFYARVELEEPLGGFCLRVVLPDGLAVGDTRAPGGALPSVSAAEGGTHLVWVVGRAPGVSVYEYEVAATVGATPVDTFLSSTATATAAVGGAELVAGETASIAVAAKGRYLRYLPALFERDELMGRLLMLFESFLGPIEGRIDHLPLYFDPQAAPAGMLPWLASWLGLVLDGRWPDGRRRRLIQSAASLYRKRGTRAGLAEYLEILGEEVEIMEHFGSGFRLGREGALGPQAILGTGEAPHTFSVVLHLPASLSSSKDPERAREASERAQTVRAVVEGEKPAHTGFDLRIAYDR